MTGGALMAAAPEFPRLLPLAAIGLVAVLLPPPRTGFSQQDEAAEQIRVASLIEELGSRSYLRREQAAGELADLANRARLQLEEAARSDDPEVRLRSQSLLRRLQIEDLWRAGQVRLPPSTLTASDAVLAIAEQTGNRIYLGDNYGAFQDGPVELPRQGEVWPLLEEICRQTGNRVRTHYGTHRDGLVLAGGAAGFPAAFAGPIRGQVTSAKREFTEEFDYETRQGKVSHTLQLNLLMTWEDRFRLIAYRGGTVLDEATTGDGRQVRVERAADTTWNVVDPGSRQMACSLRLQPPAPSADAIRRMQVGWEVVAIGGMARLHVADLETGRTYRQDDLALSIDTLEQQSPDRWRMELALARELPLPEPTEVLYRENSFELLDQHGNLMRQQGNSGGSLEGRAARLRLTFTGESRQSRPTTLVVHYPLIRDRRRMELVFEDVPLPVAVPE